jgi:integrase
MESPYVQWSEEKLKYLEKQLIHMWAEDVWIFFNPSAPKRHYHQYLRFNLTSPSLKIEVKYAIWNKFDRGTMKMSSDKRCIQAELRWVIEWLNLFDPPVRSLMDRSVEYWKESLRTYLINAGRYKTRIYKDLAASQAYREYVGNDRRILLLCQIYTTLQAAYDNRPEKEKDIWNLRSMGITVNLTNSQSTLNFTGISQPWLRHLAKKYMEYNLDIHSSGGCFVKLVCINRFSRFLEEHYPNASVSVVNRATIVNYMGFLQEHYNKDRTRYSSLSNLRVFLETCAYQLNIKGLTNEQLIFEEDFPKTERHLPREIPEGILKQLRKHLDTLDTMTLRMVVILLECGMRISELCSLSVDCLINDDKHEWYLRSNQIKTKQEHIIPLVDQTVIGTIQSQQQDIRERWGSDCRYLFPSIKSHRLPFKPQVFAIRLNKWALKKQICDSAGKLYRFTAHQFRHSVAMRLIDEDIPLDVVSRLLGHRDLKSTEVYAPVRESKVREELERVARKYKKVNSQGDIVTSKLQANDLDQTLASEDMRGQTLPVGGCGRPVVVGDCQHANKCLTCPFWLTSTDDLPALKLFHMKAIHLRERAVDAGNQFVLRNQDRIIPNLALRIAKLEDTHMNSALSIEELLTQLRTDLLEAESGLVEAREAGLLVAAKQMELIIADLKAEITALEESL